jgi:hypothetical protein
MGRQTFDKNSESSSHDTKQGKAVNMNLLASPTLHVISDRKYTDLSENITPGTLLYNLLPLTGQGFHLTLVGPAVCDHHLLLHHSTHVTDECT